MQPTNSQVALLATKGSALACEAPRFETLELPTGWTVVDLVAEQVANPGIPWSRSDAEHALAVLADRPGYAVQIPWRSA
jgi:hypothetical protein